jgi:hypothetical protein
MIMQIHELWIINTTLEFSNLSSFKIITLLNHAWNLLYYYAGGFPEIFPISNHHVIRRRCGMEVKRHLFLTSVFVGGEWLASLERSRYLC